MNRQIADIPDGQVITAVGPMSVTGGAVATVRENMILREIHGWTHLDQVFKGIELTRPTAADALAIDPSALGMETGKMYTWEIEGYRSGGTQRPAFAAIAGSTRSSAVYGAPLANNNTNRQGYFSITNRIIHTDSINAYQLYGVGASNTTLTAGGFFIYSITVREANSYVLYATNFSDGTPGLLGRGSGDQVIFGVVDDPREEGNKILRTSVEGPGYSGIDFNARDHLAGADLFIPDGSYVRASIVARRALGSPAIGQVTWRIATGVGGAVANWAAVQQRQTLSENWQTFTVEIQLPEGTGIYAFQFCKDNESWINFIEFNSVTIEVLDTPASAITAAWEPNDSLPSLAMQYSDYFKIGNILDRVPTAGLEEMFLYQYNTMTMENAMKPGGMSPAKGVYTFDNADAVVEWALENGIEVNGHALLWHSQSAAWLTTNTAGQPLTRAEARENLEEFITNVAGHYSGKLQSWDVANEVFTNNGGAGLWSSNMRTDSPWWRAYNNGRNASAGEQAWDFLYDAFVFARLADPVAKLVYNDFNDNSLSKARNMRDMANELNAKWAKDTENNSQAKDTYTGGNVEIVEAYLADGGRILVETLGLQSHHGTTTVIRTVNNNVNGDWVVENAFLIYATVPGITVALTELDIQGGSGTSYNPGTQRRQFRELFELLLEYEYLVDRVTFWGVSDVQSWRSANNPTLFASPTANDPYFRAKPAFHDAAALPREVVTVSSVSLDNAGGTLTVEFLRRGGLIPSQIDIDLLTAVLTVDGEAADVLAFNGYDPQTGIATWIFKPYKFQSFGWIELEAVVSYADPLIQTSASDTDVSVYITYSAPRAEVEQIPGNQNWLNVWVDECYSDGTVEVYHLRLLINNNAEGIYTVGSYKVYVNTKGNTQIRNIEINEILL